MDWSVSATYSAAMSRVYLSGDSASGCFSAAYRPAMSRTENMLRSVPGSYVAIVRQRCTQPNHSAGTVAKVSGLELLTK